MMTPLPSPVESRFAPESNSSQTGVIETTDVERLWLADPYDEATQNKQWHKRQKGALVHVPVHSERIVTFEHSIDRVGYDEYDVWLFTLDGKCFLNTTIFVDLASLPSAKPGKAELALAVIDEYQGLGIGSALLRHLVTIARECGISELFAEVLPDNRPMLKVFEKNGFRGGRGGRVVHVVRSLAV